MTAVALSTDPETVSFVYAFLDLHLMKMFHSCEHQPSVVSSCDMESIDEMPSLPITSQHSISLRFKVSWI
jgi:hypothetical protein